MLPGDPDIIQCLTHERQRNIHSIWAQTNLVLHSALVKKAGGGRMGKNTALAKCICPQGASINLQDPLCKSMVKEAR